MVDLELETRIHNKAGDSLEINLLPRQEELFGASTSNAPSGGGLFGGNTNANTNNASGTTGGGLFGGNTDTNQQPQPQPQQQQQPQQGGGLFGGASNTNQQPQQGGGLFGGSSNTNQQQGGGLFGSKPPAYRWIIRR